MKRINKLIIVVIIAAIGIKIITVSFSLDKKAIDRYETFWENTADYDVWFMGSSHIYYAVQPMKLWEKYGIRSFDIANPCGTITLSYWDMMCALEESTPELIVVDTYLLEMQTPTVTSMKDKVHISLDAIPISRTKISAVRDMFGTVEEQREYLFPVFLKNGKLKELTEQDEMRYDLTRGGGLKPKLNDISDNVPIHDDEYLETYSMGAKSLYKIIKECKDRDIPLLLTALPYSDRIDGQKGLNTARKIAKENGIPFLDLRYCNELLDYRIDFGDEWHVNPSGAIKLTSYIGEYLAENYKLPDYRSDKQVAKRWEKDYEEYRAFLKKKMKKSSIFENYLPWVKDDYYKVFVYHDSSRKFSDTETLLLENADDIVYITYDEAVKKCGRKFKARCAVIVTNKQTDEVVDIGFFDDDGSRIKK